MKRLLIVFLAFLSLTTFTASAQNDLYYLVVHQKSGQDVGFGFSEKPVITYTDNYLVVKTTETEMQYPLLSLSKLTFSDTPASVAPVASNGEQNPVIEFDGNTVKISGVKANASVVVVSQDGKTVSDGKANAEGLISVSLEDLPQDIYVIKAGDISFKILKK